MKNLYIYIIAIMLSWLNSYGQCITNGGFESDLTGYSFTHKSGGTFSIDNCNVNTTTGFTVLSPSATVDVFTSAAGTLVSNNTSVSGGNDPILLGCNPSVSLSRVNTGTRAIKLNRSTGGTDITTMSQIFVANSTTVSFAFSLIIENPHPENPEWQPFFTVKIYDTNNNIVSNNEICIVADANNSIFDSTIYNNPTFGNTELLYTGWECDKLNIPENLLGDTLRIEFLIADCGQSGHFGTVYIDDITCGANCTPAFGSLELNPLPIICPSEPFDVCGVYELPVNGTLNDMHLDITINGTVLQTIATPSTLTSGTFCFTVDPSLFGTNPVQDAELSVTANFNVGSFTLTLMDTSALIGSDINFLGIDTGAATVSGNTLTWEDVANSYNLEFYSDATCCPGHTAAPGYYSVTVAQNSINLATVATTLNSQCFRWRIKASECSGWSEWCCLAFDNGYDFPAGANYGNPLAPQCYNGNLCEPTLYANVDVTTGTFSFEQRRIWIQAVNDIKVNAEAIYQAGSYVELLPNFMAEYGSVFLAQIQGCYSEENNVQAAAKTIQKENNIREEEFNIANASGISLYPNPTNGIVNIQSDTPLKVITVFDITGKELLKVNNDQSTGGLKINLSALSPGIYLIYADGNAIGKVIKN